MRKRLQRTQAPEPRLGVWAHLVTGPRRWQLQARRLASDFPQGWSPPAPPRPVSAPHSSWASGCWPLTPALPAVLVPGKGLAAVLRTLPMFHDEEHARARGLPEDTLVLP